MKTLAEMFELKRKAQAARGSRGQWWADDSLTFLQQVVDLPKARKERRKARMRRRRRHGRWGT